MRCFTVATAMSLLLCLGTSVLWVRSRQVHSRVGYSTSESRYTLHSVDGALTLSGPPAKASDDSVVRDLVNGMSNRDVVFKINGDGSSLNWEGSGGGKRLMQHWVKGGFHPLAARPLLLMLDDPDRMVPAHMFLMWTQPGPPFPLPSLVNGTLSQDYDGLLVRGTPSTSDVATADPSGWRVIRDRWHDRLDRRIAHVRYMWLVAATGILPFLWFTTKYQQIRRRRLFGLCPTCHYDLTGNTSGTCPECGSPVPNTAATPETTSSRPS